jgi:hypothetical protein
MVLFPSLQWGCFRPQAGIVTLVEMASLSSLMRRYPCCHHNGIVAFVTMALLPLSGVFAIIAMAIVALVAMASLP